MESQLCKHNFTVKIEDLIVNGGKVNQEVFYVFRCSQCNAIISVSPKLFLKNTLIDPIVGSIHRVQEALGSISTKLEKIIDKKK